MKRKKQKKVFPSALKLGIVLICALICGGISYYYLSQFLKSSDYFKVNVIYKDPSLTFINNRDLSNLKGKNIFTLDLKAIQRKLSYQYPQASQLKIVKDYPNRISIKAKKRVPFAKTELKNRSVIIDEKGVVLSLSEDMDKKLPLIVGLKHNKEDVELGLPIRDKDVFTALKVIKIFQKNPALFAFAMTKIDLKNTSKIQIYLSNDLIVFIDSEEIERKMKLLGIILSQQHINIKETKYLDLRFKEPIIGKK